MELVQQPPVLNLTGRSRAGLEVVVEASAAAEMLVALMAANMTGARSTYDPRPEGLKDDPAGLPEDWGEPGSISREDLGWLSLLALAPERATPAQLLAAVEDAEPEEVWLTIWGIHIPPMVEELGLERLHSAAEGDGEAAAELKRLARTFDESKGLDAALKMTPPELKKAVLSTLDTWYRDVFAQREAKTMPILEADELRIRSLLEDHSPERVIELAGRGLEYRSEPWASRVVLMPHIAMRPWNVMGARDSDYLICYPVADETIGMEPGAPPADLVRLHRALGDEKRLRILKMLSAAEDLGLQELADGAGLAKSSTHYHMVVLRAAGLVSVTTGGRSRYRLRRDMLPRTAAMLGDFLGERP